MRGRWAQAAKAVAAAAAATATATRMAAHVFSQYRADPGQRRLQGCHPGHSSSHEHGVLAEIEADPLQLSTTAVITSMQP